MNLNFNVTGKARGKLANIIAEALNQECTYMKAPSYAYEIGAFTITRNGELEFDIADVSKDEIKTAVDAAKAAGFAIAEIDGESTETEGDSSPKIETAEDDGETALQAAESEGGGEIGEEDGGLSIAFPLEGFNPQTLDNLNKMVSSKAPLIQKALGLTALKSTMTKLKSDSLGFRRMQLPMKSTHTRSLSALTARIRAFPVLRDVQATLPNVRCR
jgi:hypothetical protein